MKPSKTLAKQLVRDIGLGSLLISAGGNGLGTGEIIDLFSESGIPYPSQSDWLYIAFRRGKLRCTFFK